MIARASQLFLPTLRDDPADAEAASHRLLVRGGFIRQVSAGLWTFMPLGWRVHRKIEQIIREEMDAIGGQEMLMPVLTPIELWEATGRASAPNFAFRVEGHPYVLAATHEETVTFHAREIQSYKQLPQLWYHFSVKDREEPRPRGGLLRVREFIMKDAYSFDRDEDGVKRSFEANREAYKKMFARCELESYDVQAESGVMGGKFSVDFLAPSGSGENVLVRCENGDYAADGDIAQAMPRTPTFPETLVAPEEVSTPGVTTCEALAEFLGIDVAATSKAMPVTKADGTVVLALVRGDDRLSEMKLYDALPGDSRPADRRGDTRRLRGERRLARPGGVQGRGPRRPHAAPRAICRGREQGRLPSARSRGGTRLRAAIRRPARAEGGRPVPRVRRGAALPDGRRSGPHLQLRGLLLEAARGDVPRRGRQGEAAPRRQLRRRPGPRHGGDRRAAPRRGRHRVAGVGRAVRRARRRAPGRGRDRAQAADALSAAGIDVLLDDRDLRAGEKFADADLIGCPVRVTAGKKSLEDGKVDVRNRVSGEDRRLAVADLGKDGL